MGMSATQARILSLVAQQSNLEYQGQQINQERSILSQQVSELYNSLLAMNVPTPPSTNEFTTIQYSGIDGATNFSLGTIIPEGNNYMVEIAYNEVGHSVTAQNSTLKVTVDENGKYIVGDSYECMSLEEAANSGKLTTDESTKKGYIEALRNGFPECAELSDEEILKNFMVYFTESDDKNYIPHFIPETTLTGSTGVDGNTGYVTAYDYEAGGRYTKTKDVHNCQLTFDSAGRITELKIPTSTGEDGMPTAFRTIKLTAETVTDEVAYQEAFAQYEYEQYKYDKEQQEINLKTEKIQEQDRTLELRLQRLDTQRSQITAEMEALDKVLGDNIESSYKTFNG